MPHRSSQNPNRPLDRGEHEGLPALSDTLSNEPCVARPEPPTLDVPANHARPWPKKVRWSFEAALFIGLVGFLAFLLTGVSASPPLVSCTTGVHMATSACVPEDE